MKANLNSGLSSNVLYNQYPSFRGNCIREYGRPCSHGPAGPALGPTENSDPNCPPMSDTCADVGWRTQQFANNDSPNVPPNIRHPNNQVCFSCSNCVMQMPSSLPTGTKVPYENLTPQQRQHREEQLPKIRWHQMTINGSPPMNNPQSNMPHGNMRMPAPHQQMGDLCGSGMMASCAPFSTVSDGDHSNDPIGGNMNNPSSLMIPNSAMGNCTQNHSNMAPNCAQLECQKMQHQFFEDRRRKYPPQLSGSSHPSPMSQGCSLNSPNPSIARSRGEKMACPPPPYRQGPRTLSSLRPSFPAANSSSLSLPSPQIQSPADSSQPFPTGTFDESDFSVNWAEFISEIKSAMRLLNWNSPEMCSAKNEPQLYTVPSPQQFQYLNTFEDQELTIQKQPNTSLRETDFMSSSELNFGSDFNSPHFPRGMENRNGYKFPGENHVNHRFTSPNMCHPHFDIPPNQRLIVSGDGTVQKFNNPSFEHSRMPPPMDVRSQQMRPSIPCPPFNGPRMDGNWFPNPQDNIVNSRMRGPNPGDIGMPRFNDNMSQSQYYSQMMHPMISKQNQFNGPPPPHGMSSCLNRNSGDGVSSTHLQNRQKMTPPFDIGHPSKMDSALNNNGQLISAHPNGPPMHPAPPGSQLANFDPIASMADMSETAPGNRNVMPFETMNMSSMQIATNNGSQAGGMVNFHTSMASSMAPQNNRNGDGMHYGMGPQMSHNKVGSPQTVNNAYENAAMSIQRLNIQNVTSPNYNSNVPMQPCQSNTPGINPMSGSPLTGNKQTMSHNCVSRKMGMNASPVMIPRLSSNSPQHPYQTHQMQQGRNPMSYAGNANIGPRGPAVSYNYPNIHVKRSAPNTIH